MSVKLLLLSTAVAVLATGCEPSCKKTCAKLLDCGEIDTPRLQEQECTRSCETQQNMFESWEASDERERFADLKRCIKESECADIADGECYDDELYIW